MLLSPVMMIIRFRLTSLYLLFMCPEVFTLELAGVGGIISLIGKNTKLECIYLCCLVCKNKYFKSIRICLNKMNLQFSFGFKNPLVCVTYSRASLQS